MNCPYTFDRDIAFPMLMQYNPTPNPSPQARRGNLAPISVYGEGGWGVRFRECTSPNQELLYLFSAFLKDWLCIEMSVQNSKDHAVLHLLHL
jgi:hypothetical protein